MTRVSEVPEKPSEATGAARHVERQPRLDAIKEASDDGFLGGDQRVRSVVGVRPGGVRVAYVEVVHIDDRRGVIMSREHVAHRLELGVGHICTLEGPASKKRESSQPDKETLEPKLQPHSATYPSRRLPADFDTECWEP